MTQRERTVAVVALSAGWLLGTAFGYLVTVLTWAGGPE